MSSGWVVRNRHYALHGWHNPDDARQGVAYGLLVPKRFAARAARRTLIKRQMRAVCVPELLWLACRLQQQSAADAGSSITEAEAEAVHPIANQFVIRFTRSYPRDDYRSAQSAPLAQRVRRDLQHLLQKAQLRFPANSSDTSASEISTTAISTTA